MAANSFFQKLFSIREDIDLDAMGHFPCPSLSTKACQKLVEPVTSEEVKRVVMTMSSFKAPGPDGFQEVFYKEFWDSLSNDVCGLVKRAFKGEPMNATIFETLVVLIPKVEVSSSLREFWPISLCNVIYKIVTKVLVNRFRPFLSEIIGPLQGGVSQGLWNLVAVSRNGPRLSHLMFADDLLLFCKASKAQVIEVMHCLDLFSRASGLKVNLHKSKAQCSKRVSERRKEVLLGVSNIRFCNDLGKYLGINIDHARASRKTAQEFLWKGQATDKGLPLVRWEVAITPKRAEGLGIKDTTCANMALLGKLVLKHKYLRNQSGMNKNSRNSSSATWKNIVSAYEHLKEGLHWNIGDKGMSWEVDSLTTLIPHEIKQFICGLRYPSLTELEPQWEWWPAATKKYSEREGYRWLLEKTLNWNVNSNWNWLWNTNILEKFKFTIWLGLHDALPTETFRSKRHLASSDMCKRFNKAQETMEHCLRDCERSKAIWHMLDPSILDSTAGIALEEWFRKALANNGASFGAGLWWALRNKCNDIFNIDNSWTDHKVVALARITAKDLQVYRNRNNVFRYHLKNNTARIEQVARCVNDLVGNFNRPHNIPIGAHVNNPLVILNREEDPNRVLHEARANNAAQVYGQNITQVVKQILNRVDLNKAELPRGVKAPKSLTKFSGESGKLTVKYITRYTVEIGELANNEILIQKAIENARLKFAKKPEMKVDSNPFQVSSNFADIKKMTFPINMLPST
ncbi:uncharacterized protein [Arachis hypogaea]|uniref:uncharacterized protein n=1 Tax=Arachis hypogaea TaxID=3818 RepID=UPI003B21C2A9